jgi:DNA-binding winged helix-turn-helix (wHTH) protein
VPIEPSISRDQIFRFGPFELSEREGELRKNGVRLKLQEQPFRVLVELVAKAGKVVSREELQQKLWPADTFVDFDVGLNTAIRKLRQALNDDSDDPHYIETLAKRGYRFVGSVTDIATKSTEQQLQPPLTGHRSRTSCRFQAWSLWAPSMHWPAQRDDGDGSRRGSLSSQLLL